MNSGPGLGIETGAKHLNPGHLVCLVESDEVLTEIERWALMERGYQVTAFSDPSECIRWLPTCAPPPAVVVSAYDLPSLTGLELLRRVKPVCPKVKTLLTSGYAASELGDLKEVDAFLSKPFTVDRLVAVVSGLLG